MEQEAVIRKMLGYTRRIAVVGLSDNPTRPSYDVAKRLIEHGYEIVPVNPSVDEVFGLTSYPSLKDVPGVLDLVDVFRRPEHLPGVARAAVEIKAKGLWLQSGLRSIEAREIAAAGGLDVVEDRCLKVEVERLEASPPRP